MPTIRRTLKNVVKNYSDAQVKVREATSNDPWGPSSTLMSEVADLTYNVVAFTEIMQMIWKRLNDDGKNWRHVYKALVLLDYIIKTGSEKVAQQCKENFHAIKTLTSFQHIDVDNKDRGMNVREKAKQLVSLLSDDERLKNERAKALKAKERFAQNAMGVGSGSAGSGSAGSGRVRMGGSPTLQLSSGGYSDPYGGAMGGYNDSSPGSGSAGTPSEMENARPASAGEEELQLQLALAMSKEEHEEEMRKMKSDEMKLQLALEQSIKTIDEPQGASLLDTSNSSLRRSSANTDPWGMPLPTHKAAPRDPWGASLPAPTQESSAFGSHASSGSRMTPILGASAPIPQPPRPSSQPYPSTDPWGMPVTSPARSTPQSVSPLGSANDPWSASPTPQSGGMGLDAFGAPAAITSNGTNGASNIDNEFDLLSSRTNDSPAKSGGSHGMDEFDLLGGGSNSAGGAWDMSGMNASLQDANRKKSPEDFLGANAKLVNLDMLVAKAPPKGTNPFAITSPGASNPFQDGSGGRVPMSQMSASVAPGFSQPSQAGLLPAPLLPMNPSQPQASSYNPFL